MKTYWTIALKKEAEYLNGEQYLDFRVLFKPSRALLPCSFGRSRHPHYQYHSAAA